MSIKVVRGLIDSSVTTPVSRADKNHNTNTSGRELRAVGVQAASVVAQNAQSSEAVVATIRAARASAVDRIREEKAAKQSAQGIATEVRDLESAATEVHGSLSPDSAREYFGR